MLNVIRASSVRMFRLSFPVRNGAASRIWDSLASAADDATSRMSVSVSSALPLPNHNGDHNVVGNNYRHRRILTVDIAALARSFENVTGLPFGPPRSPASGQEVSFFTIRIPGPTRLRWERATVV